MPTRGAILHRDLHQVRNEKRSLLYTSSVKGEHDSSLVQVVLQLVAETLSTQFVQRPGFNLPNAFPRHLEGLADFCECPGATIGQAVTQGEHRAFSFSQTLKQVFDQLCECQTAGDIGRSERWCGLRSRHPGRGPGPRVAADQGSPAPDSPL